MSEKNEEEVLELKLCPFCPGGIAREFSQGIECTSCGAKMLARGDNTITSLFARWNRRATTAEAKALKEIMGHVTGRPWLTNPDITYTDLVIILDRHGIKLPEVKGKDDE